MRIEGGPKADPIAAPPGHLATGRRDRSKFRREKGFAMIDRLRRSQCEKAVSSEMRIEGGRKASRIAAPQARSETGQTGRARMTCRCGSFATTDLQRHKRQCRRRPAMTGQLGRSQTFAGVRTRNGI